MEAPPKASLKDRITRFVDKALWHGWYSPLYAPPNWSRRWKICRISRLDFGLQFNEFTLGFYLIQGQSFSFRFGPLDIRYSWCRF